MINSLQSLRFIFALMIFHHHFFTNPQVDQFGLFPVSFFFILSGFVMTMGYGERVDSKEFSYKTYITKRLIRIFPLNILCLLLYLGLPIFYDVVNHQISLSKYIYLPLDALLLQAFIPIKSIYFSGNAVAWYLSDMLFCYLAFPFLVRWLKGKYGFLIMVLVLLAYFSLVPFIKGEEVHSLLYISPFFRIIDFMLGVISYLLISKVKIRPINIHILTCVEILAILIAVLAILIYPFIPVVYTKASLYWIPSIVLIIIFFISDRSGGGGYISRLLSRKEFVFLGSLSFTFYMLHWIFIRWYRIIEYKICMHDYPVCGSILCVLLITMISYFYVKRIEPKIVSYLNNKIQK